MRVTRHMVHAVTEMGSNVPEKCFRIRLEFTTAPPSYPTSYKYMVLVKPEECETIHDLEVLIIRKFGYPSGTVISLCVDDFCLPSIESIHLLSRDDRVQVRVVQEVVKHRKRKTKKRKDDGFTCNQEIDLSVKTSDPRTVNDQANLPNSVPGSCQKVKKSKKKHRSQSPAPTENSVDMNSTKAGRMNSSNRRHLECVQSPDQCKRQKIHNIPATQEEQSDSIKGGNNERKTHKKSHKHQRKQKPIIISNSNEKVLKNNSNDKISDHSDPGLMLNSNMHDSFEISTPDEPSLVVSTPDELCKKEKMVDGKSKVQYDKPTRRPPATTTAVNGQTSHIKFNSSGSSSEEESNVKSETCGPKESLTSWLNTAKASINHPKQTWSAKNFKDPGVSTNISSIYTNPAIPTPTMPESPLDGHVNGQLKKNYVNMLPSTWPPRVGDVIAYKVLELSYDYTPVVSDYKEAKIRQVMGESVSPTCVNSIQVELLTPEIAIKREGGKYEMDLDEDTDDEPHDTAAILEWHNLLQPKLVQ